MNRTADISNNVTVKRNSYLLSLITIGMLFFVFGFVTWINAILIPYFKIACELSNFQSYLVAFAFYISYFIMSVPSSFLLKKVGFKNGMMIGFFIMSAGAFLFVPAAMQRAYSLFLAGLFVLGFGLTILQTAANPYITLLGPEERAAQRFSIMGICNKLAGILAPLLFAAVILKPSDNLMFTQLAAMSANARGAVLDELIQRVIVPYSVVGCVLVILGIYVKRSPLPEINTDGDAKTGAINEDTKTSIIGFPHLVLGAVAIFVHVGSQVIAVDTVINYARSMDIGLLEAKVFPSYTLAATIIGYLLGISLIPKMMSQLTALRICTVTGIVLTLLIVYSTIRMRLFGYNSDASLWFVVLLGFANSMIWAGIWPLALARLGKFLKLGASLLIMGLSGNAIFPLLYGYLADINGLKEAYLVLLPCYLYLTFYAFRGYKLKTWALFKK
jgi:glucose/galactose transporter